MTERAADEGLQALLLPEERRGYRYDKATRDAAAGLTYDEAKALLRQVVKFSDGTDYDAVLLFAGATRVIDLMDTVWYLSFAGAKSSGKTTAARVARFLSHHVLEAGQLSVAGLPAAMRIARGLLLDEVDVLLKKEHGDEIAAVLRQGTDRSTPYLKLVETGRGKEWRLVSVPVFGPKILTFKRAVDDALASRSDLIRMPRARDPKIRRASTRFRRILLPVKAWLDGEAVKVFKTWSKGVVDSFLDGQEFIRMSDALRTDLDRTGQIGDLMLLVGHLYGWPIERIVQTRLGVIEEATTDDETEEVRRAVLALYISRPAVRTVDGTDARPEMVLLKKSAIKARVDLDRKAGSQRPIWANRLAEVLDDLGFERDERYSKADRERAIRVGPLEVSHLTQPLPGEVGQPGPVVALPSGDVRVPPSGPTFSRGGSEGGTHLRPLDAGPPPSGGSIGPGPEVGQRRSTDGGKPSGSHLSQLAQLPKEGESDGPVMEETENWTVTPRDRGRPKGSEP